MKKKLTVVVKLGTSVLTAGSKQLNRARMVEIVRQCSLIMKEGHKVVIVSSGAVAAGRERLQNPKLEPTVPNKQMLAAVGQGKLIELWDQLFSIYGITVGQMLLTRADLEDRERFLNAKDMLMTQLEYGVVPVINENDAVATTTFKVGDNDNLSALAAILGEAHLLLLLTDQQGLYTADPRNDPDAKLIAEVDQIDDYIRTIAGGSVSGLGTGGMGTKIQAAEIATRAGVTVVIAAGARPENIYDAVHNKSVGTLFKPSFSPLENRKRWIFGAAPAGTLHIDAGAVTALREKGSSLLPKGITKVSGTFARGAVVRIVTPEGEDIAHAVTRYNSEDLTCIIGLRSADILKTLNYEYGPNAVHRDDLIMT